MSSFWKLGVHLIPLTILVGVLSGVSGSKRSRGILHSTPSPRFQDTEDNYTYHKGERAILYCSVKDLGTRKVIWRKPNDTVFLTVGKEIVTSDTRFAVNHIAEGTDWNLMISNLTTADTGAYECQIASTNKDLRKEVYLNVKDEYSYASPSISISGTLHVDRGTKLTLTCNATGAITPPDFIDWFKDGIKIVTDEIKQLELEKKVSINSRTISSTLTKASAEMSDTGTYSCRTSDLQIISEKVNVLYTNRSPNKREPNNGHASYSIEGGSFSIRPQYSTFTLLLCYICFKLVYNSGEG